MTLIAGKNLKTGDFFQKGNPEKQGSSFDLSIGKIYDSNGEEAENHYVLKPGQMVQVVSAEIFDLPNNITGHVTYKTALTQVGIWALTVGIVDPGWNGPISTTLLNFSRQDYTINKGDSFLRVSFFKHESVHEDDLRRAPELEKYLNRVKFLASSTFPSTFLDSEKISKEAEKRVLNNAQRHALIWVGLIAFIFTLIQVLAPVATSTVRQFLAPTEIHKLEKELGSLKEKISNIENKAKAADSAKN